MQSWIYRILCLYNNFSYVGLCSNFKDREYRHFKSLENGTNSEFLQNDYNKYGKEYFVFEILERTPNDKKILAVKEIEWTIKLNSIFPNGYNKTIGGQLGASGYKFTKKQKESVRERVLGINNPNYGNKWTDEQKKEASNKLKGNNKDIKKSKKHRKKISESNKGKHNHKGENNPKFKVTEELFIKIKSDIIKLTNEGKFNYQIEKALSDKYNLGEITIARIRKGQHLFSKKYGSLKDWLKEEK